MHGATRVENMVYVLLLLRTAGGSWRRWQQEIEANGRDSGSQGGSEVQADEFSGHRCRIYEHTTETWVLTDARSSPLGRQTT